MGSRQLIAVGLVVLLVAGPVEAGWKRGLVRGSSSSSNGAAGEAEVAVVGAASFGAAVILARAIGSGVTAATLSSDGETLAVGFANGSTRLVRPDTGQLIGRAAHHYHAVTALALDDAGRYVAGGSSFGTVRVLDRRTLGQVSSFGRSLAIGPWRSAPVGQVGFSPDAKWLVISGEQHGVRLAEPASARTPRLMESAGAAPAPTARGPKLAGAVAAQAAARVAFLADGRMAVASPGATVPRILDPAAAEVALEAAPGKAGEPIVAIAALPQSTRFATGSTDGTVVLWDAATRREVSRHHRASAAVRAIALSPDALVTGSDNGEVEVLGPTGAVYSTARVAVAGGAPVSILEVRLMTGRRVRCLAEFAGALYLLDVDGTHGPR